MNKLNNKNIYDYFSRFARIMFLSLLHMENYMYVEVAYVNLTYSKDGILYTRPYRVHDMIRLPIYAQALKFLKH